jgi:hypothetical protein
MQGKEGIVIVKTTQAILVTHYPGTVQPGSAANTVEQLACGILILARVVDNVVWRNCPFGVSMSCSTLCVLFFLYLHTEVASYGC